VHILDRIAQGDGIKAGRGRYPSGSFFEIDTPMKIAQPAVDCLILKATRSTPVTIRSAN
jgi:hypothetical protein